MALSGNYKHGHKGTVKVGGYTLPTTEWNWEETAQLDECTNARSGGYGEDVAGNKRLAGDVTCVWDEDQYPNTSPVNIRAGAEVTLTLQMNDDQTPWTVDVIVEKMGSPGVNQDGKLTYKFNWKSQGAYTLPTG